MDFWGTILVLFRRWYITLPAFALAVAASGAVYVSKPTYYMSYSILVLTAPTSGGSVNVGQRHATFLANPLLYFGQGLSNTAAVLIQALNTPEMSDQLGVRPSGDATFKVSNGTSNPELLISGPLAVITAQSTSPGKAQDLVGRVTQRARQELVDRQQGLQVPPSTYIVLSEVVPPTTPQPQRGTRLRPAISALALGCIASVAAAFVGESIMTRPGRRRRAHPRADGRMAAGPVANSEGNGAAQTGPPSVVAASSPFGTAVLTDERQV